MTAIGITPRGPVIAEDVRDFQQWPGHAIGLCCWRRRAALSRPLAGAAQLFERALDCRDPACCDPRVARRRIQLVVSKRPRVIMRTFLCH